MARCACLTLLAVAFAPTLKCIFASNETELHNETLPTTTLRGDVTANTSFQQEKPGEEREESWEQWDRRMQSTLHNVTTLLRDVGSSDLLALERLNISACEFGINTSFVVCEFIGEAWDYKPFIRYDFHLHFTIIFRTMADNCVKIINGVHTENKGRESNDTYNEENQGLSHESHCLLRFWKVHMKKVDGDNRNKNLTQRPLGPSFLLFLSLSVARLQWEMYFSADVAVGLLYLGSTGCSDFNRNQSTCTKRVELVNFPKIFEPASGYRETMWTVFRTLAIDTLGGHNATLSMLCNSDFNVSIYIAPLLNGTGLTSLSITGHKHWPTMQPILEKLPQLKHLDLSSNNLMYINASNFQQAPNIEDMNLSSTNIQIIPVEITLLHKLKRLDLSRNKLNYSQLQFSNVLHNFTNLKWFSISHTNLTSLKYLHHLLLGGNNSESQLRLEYLDISNCGILSLDDTRIFRDHTSLQSINLSGNDISFIPPKLFIDLPDLKYLYLSHTNLREGPLLELGFGKMLYFIDLSYNKLTFPGNILSSGRVSKLDLSHNEIKNWSDPFLFAYSDFNSLHNGTNMVRNTWVDSLNMSYNLLSAVTTVMGTSLTPLTTIDLGENPFDCANCHVEDFKTWINDLQNKLGVVEVILLGERRVPMCSRGEDMPPLTILDAHMSDTCFKRSLSYWLVTGIILISCVVFGAFLGLLFYRYKFEVAYLMFLLKQKKKRDSMDRSGDFEYDAFVSYSRLDREWVLEEMTPTLENSEEKFRLCLHERDFILGSFISLNIVRSIQRSRYTILVLSNNFVQSQWCRFELEMANHRMFETGREFLILVELERLNHKIVPPHLKYLMDTRTYLEWPESGTDTADVWKRLKTCLGKSLYLQEKEKHAEGSTQEDNQTFEELSL